MKKESLNSLLIVGGIVVFVLAIQVIEAEETQFIDPEISKLLAENNEVYVIIQLIDDSGINYDNAATQEEKREIYKKRAEYFLQKEEKFLSELDESEFELGRQFKLINAVSGFITQKGLDKIKNNPEIISIEADRLGTLALSESGPIIGSNIANRENFTGEGIAVCIMDTGIDYTHSALGGCTEQEFLKGQCAKVPFGHDYCREWLGFCFGEDENPMDENGHGTYVSGIVASEHSTYTGIAPDAKLTVMKVCDEEGQCSSGKLGEAVDTCVGLADTYNIKAITISLSWSDPTDDPDCRPFGLGSETDIINNAYDSGMFIDSASGNDGSTEGTNWPACTRGATSVGATTKTDFVSWFTNRGTNLDLLTPGEFVTSTWLNNEFAGKSGTSVAAPHVAGSAALLYQQNSNLLPDDVESKLKETGLPIYDFDTGLTFPRINVAAALDVESPQCGDTITQDTVLTEDIIDCTRDGLIVEADNITIDCNGRTIDGTNGDNDEGIYLWYKDGVTIKNCKIKEFENGIDLYNSNSNLIFANTISDNVEDGIYTYGSVISNNIIWANTIKENGRYAIYFRYRSYNNTIFDNVISGNARGIKLESSSISDNKIYSNNISNFGGIDVSGSDNKISKNILRNGHGIYVSGPNARISENFIENTTATTIYLSDGSNDAIISENVIINSTGGVYLYKSSNGTLSNNQIINSGDIGINLYGSNFSVIFGNKLINNRYRGIELESNSNYNNIHSNEITGNSLGIWLYDSSNNTIFDNIARNNLRGGISLFNSRYASYTSADNEVFNNIIENNIYYGIQLYNSSNNRLYQNIVKNNVGSGFSLDLSSDNNFINDNNISNNENGIFVVNISRFNLFYENIITNNGENNAYEDFSSTSNGWNFSIQGNCWDDFKQNEGFPHSYVIPGEGNGIDYHPICKPLLINISKIIP